VFKVAIDDKLLQVNSMRAAKLLREDNARTRYLTDDEEARVRAELALTDGLALDVELIPAHGRAIRGRFAGSTSTSPCDLDWCWERA